MLNVGKTCAGWIIFFNLLANSCNILLMNLHQIHPTPEQIAALQKYPPNQAIVMVNILKYKASTPEGLSGQEVYQRYVNNALPLIQKAGGKLVWQGQVQQTVIGEVEGQPDTIFLVEYPSVQNFLQMAISEDYQKIANDRTIALEYGGLAACTPTL